MDFKCIMYLAINISSEMQKLDSGSYKMALIFHACVSGKSIHQAPQCRHLKETSTKIRASPFHHLLHIFLGSNNNVNPGASTTSLLTVLVEMVMSAF